MVLPQPESGTGSLIFRGVQGVLEILWRQPERHYRVPQQSTRGLHLKKKGSQNGGVRILYVTAFCVCRCRNAALPEK